MTTQADSPRPKRTLSAEHLQKMQAGRRAAARTRAATRASAAPAEVEVKGQRLTRVERATVQSIDDVIERHLDEDLAAGQSPIEQADDDEAALPSVEELADRADIYTEYDAVPPAESDPHRRDRPTMGPVEPIEDHSDGELRTLLDIYRRYPVGDGQYQIYVTRTFPKSTQGIPCAGVQAPITEQMSIEEFCDVYGGGSYDLIVYGPPARGGEIGFDGTLSLKALTKPIKLVIPGVPNLDSMPGLNGEANMSSLHQIPSMRRPASSGDARLREVELSHQERQEERARTDIKEREERLRSEHRQQETVQSRAVNLLAEQRSEELERERERHEREIERLEKEHKQKIEIMTMASSRSESISETIQALQPFIKRDDSGIETRLTSLTDQLRAADDRVRDITERADKRAREAEEAATRRVKEAEERADRRIAEEGQKAAERIRELEARHDRSLSELRRDYERQVGDAQRRSEERIADEGRSHARDLTAHQTAFETRMESLKQGYELQLAQLKAELERERTELARSRTELANAGDLTKQLAKAEKTAAALGWEKPAPGGGETTTDWKSIGFEFLRGVPELVKGLAETWRAGNQLTPQQIEAMRAAERMQMGGMAGPAQQLPSAPEQARGGRRHLSPRRPVFVTEDGPSVARYAQQPQYVPPAQPFEEPPSDHSSMVSRMQTDVDALAGMPGAPQYIPPAPAPPPPQQQLPLPLPVQQQSAPPPPQPAPAAAPASQIDPRVMAIVAQARGPLEEALQNNIPAEHVAAQIIANAGPPVAGWLASVGQETIVAAIEAQPGGESSPLVRRAGQKYIEEIMAAVMQQTAAASPN